MRTTYPNISRPQRHVKHGIKLKMTFTKNNVFVKLKAKNVIITFLKGEGECANYFLYEQLGRDGRNETENRPTINIEIRDE